MTRYVKRRAKPRAPWEWKNTWPVGAPKTALTNIHWMIFRPLTDQTKVIVGDYDPLLRLYRRREPATVLPEWDHIPDRCQWLELVDDDEEIVLRLDMKSARMWGQRTPRGWKIPLEHYTSYEQEN